MAATALARAVPDTTAAVEAVTERPAQHPWFSACSVDRRGVARLTSRWSTEQEWFLDEHRTAAGEALLPGAGYFELDACRPRRDRCRPALRDPRPHVPPTARRPRRRSRRRPDRADADGGRLRRRRPPSGRRRCGDRGGRRAAPGAPDGAPSPKRRCCCTPCRRPSASTSPPSRRCATEREPVRTHQQDHLRFGPRWDVVQRVQRGDRQAIAWLELPAEFVGDLDTVGLHPALVDLGTGFAMSLIDGYTGDQLWVPLSYRSIGVHGTTSPPARRRRPGAAWQQRTPRLRPLRRRPLRRGRQRARRRPASSPSSVSTVPSTSASAAHRWPPKSSSTTAAGERAPACRSPSSCSSTTCPRASLPDEGRRTFAARPRSRSCRHVRVLDGSRRAAGAVGVGGGGAGAAAGDESERGVRASRPRLGVRRSAQRPSRRASSPSGRSCSASTRSVCRTTSSTSAATA